MSRLCWASLTITVICTFKLNAWMSVRLFTQGDDNNDKPTTVVGGVIRMVTEAIQNGCTDDKKHVVNHIFAFASGADEPLLLARLESAQSLKRGSIIFGEYALALLRRVSLLWLQSLVTIYLHEMLSRCHGSACCDFLRRHILFPSVRNSILWAHCTKNLVFTFSGNEGSRRRVRPCLPGEDHGSSGGDRLGSR